MALFGKKTDAAKDEVKYEVPAQAAATSLNFAKIPTVLTQPRISEKAGRLAGMNKYVFKVANKANKVEVKKAVEAAYKVRVTQVNIVTNQGKKRNFGSKTGMTSAFKKAIVTLKQGDKIEGLTDVV